MAGKYTILLILIFAFASCDKEDEIPVSGIATINNKLTFNDDLQTPTGYGFLFSKGELVSTHGSTPPDITVYTDGLEISLQAANLLNSFYLAGNYADAALAQTAFKNLTSLNLSAIQWEGMATPLAADQIWIYRSQSENYAKIRIIGIVSEIRDNRDYVECRFEWAYQPDGSANFPGK